MKHQIPLNSLRTFEICARLESVQETAKFLHLTPSAVSHQLKKLEEEIGIELFVRGHRKITPTTKGKMLQNTLNQAFNQISHMLESIQDNNDSELVINVLPVFSIRWLNQRLLNFFASHPDINLTIRNSYRVEKHAVGKYDLAIRWGEGDWPGVYSEKLFDEYAMPVASPKLLESGALRNEKDLLTFPLIQMFDDADHWEYWSKLKGYNLPNTTRIIKYNDPAAALQAASDGLGVAMGPLALISEELKQGKLIAPFPDPINTRKGYYLVYANDDNAKKESITKFISWILKEASCYKKEYMSLS